MPHYSTHNMTKTRIYRIWFNMRQRCNMPSREAYFRYGGRGIKVCERWDKSFENFYEDTKEGYAEHLTLDRIDNDGNYEPNNTRWVTRDEQMNNTRRSIKVTYKGETLSLTGWAKRLGMNKETIFYRYRQKWSIEDMLTIPVSKGWIYKQRIDQDLLSLKEKNI